MGIMWSQEVTYYCFAILCIAAALKMAARQAAPRSHDSRLPHVHSTHRNTSAVTSTTQGHGQGQGPWKHYQLKVDNGQFEQPVKGNDDDDDGGRKRSTLDPALRAGCVPATAYPSFRTIPHPPPPPTPPPPPPPPAASYRQRLPRVSGANTPCPEKSYGFA